MKEAHPGGAGKLTSEILRLGKYGWVGGWVGDLHDVKIEKKVRDMILDSRWRRL